MTTYQCSNQEYVKKYSPQSFWRKIIQSALQAGKEAVYYALVLYYSLEEKTSPSWTRTTVIGTLGYFIYPFDAIPDLTPVIGFSDDFTALTAAYLMITSLVGSKPRAKAEEALSIWFD